MGTIRGYARVSRPSQKTNRQKENIWREFPGIKIYEEKYTGTKIEGRDELKKLLRVTKSGDTIVFDSVSRMSRNADDGINLYFELFDRGVNLIFLNERYIDTDVYKENLKDRIELTGTDIDDIFIGLNNYFRKLAKRQIRIAFEQAQKEADDISQRTKEGIAVARANNKQIGQQKGRTLNIKKKEPTKALILKHSKDFGGTLSDAEVIKLSDVCRNTYYKYKRELLQEYQSDVG